MDKENILRINDGNFDKYFFRWDKKYSFNNNIENNSIIVIHLSKKLNIIEFISIDLPIKIIFFKSEINWVEFRNCKLKWVHFGSPVQDSEIGCDINKITIDSSEINFISINYLNKTNENAISSINIKKTTFDLLYFFKLYYWSINLYMRNWMDDENGDTIINGDIIFNNCRALSYMEILNQKFSSIKFLYSNIWKNNQNTNFLIKNCSLDVLTFFQFFIKDTTLSLDKLKLINLQIVESNLNNWNMNNITFDKILMKSSTIYGWYLSCIDWKKSKYIINLTWEIIIPYFIWYKNDYINFEPSKRKVNLSRLWKIKKNNNINNVKINKYNKERKIIEDIDEFISKDDLIRESKENYRQLKYIYDNLWNKLEWNKFYRMEMKEEWKLIKGLNKLVYFFNGIISNFWTNWFRTILFIIMIWLLYMILNYKDIFHTFDENIFTFIYNIYKFDPNQIIVIFDNLPNEFAQAINPFHGIINKDEITIFTLTHQFILVVLYYQLIVSLKRLTPR